MQHLCSLPEEILLLIMELLDPTSMQCLRRTSRVFLRLFSFPCFRGQHNRDLNGMPQSSRSPFFPWARASRIFEAEAHTQQFIDLLERDAKKKLCSDCRARASGLAGFQRTRSFIDKLLYCTGCKTDHPLAYFSAAQRQPWCDATRVCVGREGHVRLCEHLVIGWDAISDAAGDLQDEAPGCTDVFVIMPLLKCQETSHIAMHHKATDKAHPRLKLVRHRGRTWLRMSWTGHLTLPRGRHNGYSACDMTDDLSRLRTGAAEHIAPRLGPGYLQEMRLFDPNRCGFLDYTGTSAGNIVPGDWSFGSFGPQPSDTAYQSCRLRSGCSLHDKKGGEWTQTDGITVGSHVTSTILGQEPGMTGSEYGCFIKTRPCRVRRRCLELFYARNIIIQPMNTASCTKVTHAWFEAVDPDSYALREDAETYGTLWCRDEACANYYRYLDRPVLRTCRRKLGHVSDKFRTYASLTPDQFRPWPATRVERYLLKMASPDPYKGATTPATAKLEGVTIMRTELEETTATTAGLEKTTAKRAQPGRTITWAYGVEGATARVVGRDETTTKTAGLERTIISKAEFEGLMPMTAKMKGGGQLTIGGPVETTASALESTATKTAEVEGMASTAADLEKILTASTTTTAWLEETTIATAATAADQLEGTITTTPEKRNKADKSGKRRSRLRRFRSIRISSINFMMRVCRHLPRYVGNKCT